MPVERAVTLARIVPHLCLRAGLVHAIRVTPAGIFIRAGRLERQIESVVHLVPPGAVLHSDPFDPEYRRRAARKANP